MDKPNPPPPRAGSDPIERDRDRAGHRDPRARVCGVEFLNAWPLVKPLTESEAPRHPFTVTTALPSECARQLADGVCDIALVPVASYAAHGSWDIVPEIGIGCDGPVETVVLVSEVPLARITTIHLDAASRSSATLIRVLMHRRGLRPRYTVVPHREGQRFVRGREAALIIGDAAFNLGGRFAHTVDLGSLWREDTGLPFVFAFWAARRGVLASARGAGHVAALIAARECGLTRTAEYAARYRRQAASDPTIAASDVLPAAAYRRYLERTIRYELDTHARAGLRLFLRLVRDLGLAPRDRNLDAWCAPNPVGVVAAPRSTGGT